MQRRISQFLKVLRDGLITDVPPEFQACESCRIESCDNERAANCEERRVAEAQELARRQSDINGLADSKKVG